MPSPYSLFGIPKIKHSAKLHQKTQCHNSHLIFFLIIFMLKNLRISQKCSNFAADFAL